MSPVATSTLGQLRIELADTLDDESVVVVHRDMVDAPSPPCL
ncbi:MAG TPA: hypothetical protein VLL25_07615 [Acidimicrobiales bacterium]|nr:hypothetical protein [Acidimicrobiales bacterium]